MPPTAPINTTNHQQPANAPQTNAQQVQQNMAMNPMGNIWQMIMPLIMQSMYNPMTSMLQSNPAFRDMYGQQMMMQMQGGIDNGMGQMYQMGMQLPWLQNLVHGQIAQQSQKMLQQQEQERQWNYAVNQPQVQAAMMRAAITNGVGNAAMNQLNATPFMQNLGQNQQNYQMANGVTPTAAPGPYSAAMQRQQGTNLSNYNMQQGTPVDQLQTGSQQTAQQQNP